MKILKRKGYEETTIRRICTDDKKKVVAIEMLMERDGMTREEAIEEIRFAQNQMMQCGYDPDECEEILYEELGLELDYLVEVVLLET